MLHVYTEVDNHIAIEMSVEDMQELRSELKAWDGVITLGDVAAELLKQLMEIP